MGSNGASVLFYHSSMERLAKSIVEHCQVHIICSTTVSDDGIVAWLKFKFAQL